MRANAPGNVLLKKGEANLSKKSVVNVSQIHTIDKSDLLEKIGSVSPKKMDQIITVVQQLIEKRSL